MDEKTLKAMTNFIYEMYYLTHFHRSGWDFLLPDFYRPEAFPNPKETIAFHEIESARDAFFIALLKKKGGVNVNLNTSAVSMLFHDSFEVRTSDLNAVSKKYFMYKFWAEHRAFNDMISGLCPKAKELLEQYRQNFNNRFTTEGLIGKEADRLQMLRQAKYYLDDGYRDAQEWINSSLAKFILEEVKEIAEKIKKTECLLKEVPNIKKCSNYSNNTIMNAKIAFVIACAEWEKDNSIDIEMSTVIPMFQGYSRLYYQYYEKFFSLTKKEINSVLQELKDIYQKNEMLNLIISDASRLQLIFKNKIIHEQDPQKQRTVYSPYQENLLITETAKKIAQQVKNTSYAEWWKNIKI